jgi:5-methylcytosine-specific restriction endonuclease McrA
MPHTPEQKQRQRDNEHRYKKSPKGLAAARVRDRKRRKTPEGRAMRKQYRESEKGRQAAVRGAAKRRARKLEQLCDCCDPNEREQTYAAGWIEEDCYICGAPADRTDHVIPLAVGKPGDGLHCIKNFRPICKDCNEAGGKWYTLWPAHLGWDESPGWEDFLTSRRALAVAT